ncbi:MAG: hypothetical protein ACHQNE_02780 [Candidatus Kapaibacterium sp.]
MFTAKLMSSFHNITFRDAALAPIWEKIRVGKRSLMILFLVLIFSNARSQSITPTGRVDWLDLTTIEHNTMLQQHITKQTEVRMVLKYPAIDLISLSRDSLFQIASNSVNDHSLREPLSIEGKWYDSTGNLKHTYYLDGPKGVITLYHYDSAGKNRTRLSAWYKETNETLWNHFILYDAQGRAYALKVTDSNATTLDSLGVENGPFGILNARHFDRNGVLTDAASNEFDAKGRIIAVQRENFTSKNRAKAASYWTYDAAGRLLTTVDSDSYQDMLIVGKAHYNYDEKGRISRVDWNKNEVELYVYGTEGADRDSLVRRIRTGKDTLLRTYQRDPEGHIIDEVVYGEGKPFSRRIRSYDNGLLTQEIEINPYDNGLLLREGETNPNSQNGVLLTVNEFATSEQ